MRGFRQTPLFSVGRNKSLNTPYLQMRLIVYIERLKVSQVCRCGLITTDYEVYMYMLQLIYIYIAIPCTIYQTFIKQTIVITAASWPHYIDLCVSTHELLLHACMRNGFSVAIERAPYFNGFLHLTAQINSHSFTNFWN